MQWIATSTGKPEPYQTLLLIIPAKDFIFGDTPKMYFGFMRRDGTFSVQERDRPSVVIDDVKPTHWLPIPELPREASHG